LVDFEGRVVVVERSTFGIEAPAAEAGVVGVLLANLKLESLTVGPRP
jgi:hypothetical protein